MTKRPDPPDTSAEPSSPQTSPATVIGTTGPTAGTMPIPPDGAPQKSASGSHAMRRGGARREVTERVLLKPTGSSAVKTELEGWALNLSRGGLRCILEEKVELGGEYLVTLGEGDNYADRRARVVWVQEEPDGVIVGVEFVGLSGIHLPLGTGTSPPPKPPTMPPPPPAAAVPNIPGGGNGGTSEGSA